ncbi:MAG: hypothetical protein A2600_05305 [Candidatus Lambdaproteobacteria bacterium RIFOXYD1_FULL_56_27]|uniref:Outer-membrane lipoprotein carrier protein n=1 Tax=Candidatus Lambdaproteobacteria bacterium RIFOXYD2_FULL_56_26 TaxID=1817773 RepID=A0A1F6GRK7_9PROT|nr:MAG: hypothetical protein A2426_08160 [Candidatus Lambdaproteobacteria bacterium RIFOXYC1_FULL_56_13]OGH00765.1 MAG: hypothetical protein A2557_03580 [Candidatus Lambdaproteobacteria bacterium RIFOXYD2_FULL_56_26]OGH09970.1 MAG: hypothetical protein A2600_05305 [Candidatus Lambdaproteobacteria bacterium RIFOXYD1_FULL_56_27]
MGITLRLLALGLVWTSCGGATTGLAGELEKLEAALAKTSSFSAHFIQKTYNPLRDKTVVLSGRLSWMRPGLVRFEYQEPDPLLVVVGKRQVWIYDPILENVTLEPKAEVDRLEALSFFFGTTRLTDLYEPLSKPQHTSPLAQGAGWIYLKPKKPTPGLVELHLQPGLGLLRGFLVFDDQGNWRLFELEQPNQGPAPKAEDFEFKIPEGMEVIDKLTVAH